MKDFIKKNCYAMVGRQLIPPYTHTHTHKIALLLVIGDISTFLNHIALFDLVNNQKIFLFCIEINKLLSELQTLLTTGNYSELFSKTPVIVS